MKNIKKYYLFNENLSDFDKEQELIYLIEDIISIEVDLREVPYSRSETIDMEKDPETITSASKSIVNMLKEKGLLKI